MKRNGQRGPAAPNEESAGREQPGERVSGGIWMETDNKKLLRLGAAVFAALAAAILFYFFLLRFEKVKALFDMILSALQPLFVGIVMAYLLYPLVRFWERQCFKVRFLSRIARPLSVFATMLLTAGVLGMFCALVLPQLVESLSNLAGDLPGLLEAQLGRVDAFLKSNSDAAAAVMQMISSVESFLADWIRTELFSTVSVLAGNILSVGSAAVNLCVSVVVAVYLLLDRERYLAQCRKLFHSVSPNDRVNRAVSDFVRQTDKIFSGFISGKLLDSLIVGMICYLGLLILNMPYVLLISVIVGVTNIIPVFGPYIGAIPSAFLLLLVSPEKCMMFILFILILQQLDGNVIGPHILGNSTGISAFYITVAVMLFGKLLGFAGMVAGVPLFAALYYLVKRLSEFSLERQGKPVDTSAYIQKEDQTQHKAGRDRKGAGRK